MNTTDHGITCHCRKCTDYLDQDHATTNDPRPDEFKQPEGTEPDSGHWPAYIVEKMNGRNVLTVALDLIGGVRGANDLCLSDCANALTVLEWYLDNWRPSSCQFDAGAFQCIKAAKEQGDDWFRTQASDMSI